MGGVGKHESICELLKELRGKQHTQVADGVFPNPARKTSLKGSQFNSTKAQPRRGGRGGQLRLEF